MDKTSNLPQNPPLQQTAVVRSFLSDCVYHNLSDRAMCPNKNVCSLCLENKSELYHFVIANKSGFVFETDIPVDNDVQADAIKELLSKSKNISSIKYFPLK
jgi:hypothetical protein